jgi:hypothetical protein
MVSRNPRPFPAETGRHGRRFLTAQGIEAEIPQTRRRRVEELERIARFAAFYAANAPKFKY